MMILNWRQLDPVIVTRWRGEDGGVAPAAIANPPYPIPTLIGPPGVAGPVGPPIDITVAVIDGGTFN
jgi:hypothetical protein